MLGDSYGAAVVAALSKKELMAMDELNAKMKEEEEKAADNGNEQVAVQCRELTSNILLFDVLLITFLFHGKAH